MLIFTRRVGESVVMGNVLSCKILGFIGNQVHIGFEAPRALSINRKEVQDLIQHEKKGDQSMNAELIDSLIAQLIIAASSHSSEGININQNQGLRTMR